jgi:four helix bundle protein
MENKRGPIRSFRDLEIYQNTYKAAIMVMKEIIPVLPKEEQYSLKDQMNRCCKTIPTLIAEGFAKRHQKSGFKKYLDDALAECNEIINHLSFCRDLYADRIGKNTCDELIDIYDKSSRQIFKLRKVWHNFN